MWVSKGWMSRQWVKAFKILRSPLLLCFTGSMAAAAPLKALVHWTWSIGLEPSSPWQISWWWKGKQIVFIFQDAYYAKYYCSRCLVQKRESILGELSVTSYKTEKIVYVTYTSHSKNGIDEAYHATDIFHSVTDEGPHWILRASLSTMWKYRNTPVIRRGTGYGTLARRLYTGTLKYDNVSIIHNEPHKVEVPFPFSKRLSRHLERLRMIKHCVLDEGECWYLRLHRFIGFVYRNQGFFD